jgi:putative phosphoesterase
MRDSYPIAEPSGRYDVMKIGVISDTHGQLDKHAIDILSDTDLILHAGDIDGPEVLDALEKIGTVVPVRGNMDYGVWSRHIPREEFVEVGGLLVYMIHDVNQIGLDPAAADIRIVISGHTHRPVRMKNAGVLYLNPGSASFPRGGAAASVARVDIKAGKIFCRHIAV